MLTYIFDGSFDGLLTCIYEAYYRREEPNEIISNCNIEGSLIHTNVYIITDSEKASRVYRSIEEKISQDALHHIYYAFLSELRDVGTWIYHYLKLGWKVGRSIEDFHHDDRVNRVHKISRKVSFEIHRMYGLLRFVQLDRNVYYASIEPDFNITALLAPHFADRFADQNWVIHDVKRKIAAIYNCSEWIISDLKLTLSISLNENELNYQNLWKLYFKDIAIQSRINPKLQRQHMPQRYWKHLIEKQM